MSSAKVTSQTSYEIPLTQRAVVFETNNGPILLKTDWPVTQPSELLPGQILVRIAYSGVCHTDLHAWLGDWPLDNKLPLVGGHEGAGYVAAIADATETKLKIGDPVGVQWLAKSCLDCEACRTTYEASCPDAVNSGFSSNGSFQQWCVAYASHVTPIPAGYPLEMAAPILCAGVTVYKALKTFQGTPGQTVVIPGAGGGLGHLAVQYALAMGYRVIAIDSGEEKRELVASFGCTDFIDFKEDGDVVAKVKALSGGLGVHAAIVVASSAAAYKQALEMLRPAGALVAVGLPPAATIEAGVFWTVLKSLRILGSYVGNRQDSIEALDIAARGKVETSIVVQKLETLPEVYDKMKSGKLVGRVVLDCQ